MWQYDVNSSGTLTAEEQYFFVHDAKGRVVASMRHTGTGDVVTIQEAFVYHAAGVAGRGGSSPSESAILRDVDSGYVWNTDSDNVLNVRTFYVQNWKGDVVAVLDSDGKPLERVRYTAFGTPSAHPIADVDGNGKVEAADVTKFLAFAAGGANATVFTETDLNADGLFPDDADTTFFDQQYTRVGAGSVFGMNKLSSVASRKGYAGYEWDGSITSWHVRHRVLDSASGKWTRMDPLEYVDGASVFGYCAGRSVRMQDPSGLDDLWFPFNSQICNDTDRIIMVWSGRSGFIYLMPGECTSGFFDDGDYVYIPGRGWVKCPGGPASCRIPNDAVPTWPTPNGPWTPARAPGADAYCELYCGSGEGGDYCLCFATCSGETGPGCKDISPDVPPPSKPYPLPSRTAPGRIMD